MKKLAYISIALLVCAAAVARPTIAFDYASLNKVAWDTNRGSKNQSAVWYQNNPFDGNYQAASDTGKVDWVKLIVKAADINPDDEKVTVNFYDRKGNKQNLQGFLLNGENVYYLDPTWLGDTNKVKARINYTRSSKHDFKDDFCVEWSKLCIESNCPVVPAPGAIVLGSIGSFMVAGLRTIKTRKG